MIPGMALVQFPQGDVLWAERPFDEEVFAETDRVLAQGFCREGRLEIETAETRLTCLFHRSAPHLAGLQEKNRYSWVPLAEFPSRARQMEGARCRLMRSDAIRVLLVAVHFRNRPVMQASTELLDLAHVLNVLEQKGEDAAIALERGEFRTLLFLQKGKAARVYFGDPREDSGDGDASNRFLLSAFRPDAGASKIEVYNQLNIEPDEDAGAKFAQLAEAASPPPPTTLVVKMAGRIIMQRAFMPPAMTIGRDFSCELNLDNLSISRRHARLSWQRGKFVIEDLDSANGTKIDGKSITRSTITIRDRVHMGKFVLSMTKAAQGHHPDATMIMTAATQPAFLIGPSQQIQLLKEITIGSSAQADLRARGFRVRGIHASVQPKGQDIYQLQCTGKAKVQVNGKKVRATLLHFGDQIQLGRSRFRLVPHLAAEPTDA